MHRVFMTFGAGRTGWINASQRITKEAKDSNLFDTHLCLDFSWLKTNDPEIAKLISDMRRKKNFRGFGYWAWKPAVLLWARKEFPKSHLVYIDAGSHIRDGLNQLKLLENSLLESEDRGSLAWNLPGYTDEQWTKAELVDYLKPKLTTLNSSQVQSGFVSISPLDVNNELLAEWRRIASLDDGFYLTDELTIPQETQFIEHRHDQSILSLLWKEMGLYSKPDETFPYAGNEFGLISSRNNTSMPFSSSQRCLTSRRYLDLLVDKILVRK